MAKQLIDPKRTRIPEADPASPQTAETGGVAGLNETPRGERLHIAVFGRRNVGKSSLINALANQEVAITSATPGTTTDPVYKSMEILPIGPVVLIDTAGLDDEGTLGSERVRRSINVLDKTDLAVLAVDALEGWGSREDEILSLLQKRWIPVIVVLNKIDALTKSTGSGAALPGATAAGSGPESAEVGAEARLTQLRSLIEAHAPGPVVVLSLSAQTRDGIEELKAALIQATSSEKEEPSLLGDLVEPGDTVILVAPIDRSAPKGRLILPQVQAIRDLLDHHALALTVQDSELAGTLAALRKAPRLIVTDSQVFKTVNALTPPDITLTSFSILFARYKGDLLTLTAGAKAIGRLKPGDRILIAEACTHHRTEDDIGKVKIPAWLEQKVGGKLSYSWASGGSLPEDLSEYRLIVHCGSCMLNRRQMLSRLHRIASAGVPVVNYGISIAYLHGILDRVLSPFPDALKVLRQEDENSFPARDGGVFPA